MLTQLFKTLILTLLRDQMSKLTLLGSTLLIIRRGEGKSELLNNGYFSFGSTLPSGGAQQSAQQSAQQPHYTRLLCGYYAATPRVISL